MSDDHTDRRARPLTGDDLGGLIPTFVATWADVDLAEQANIEAATRWAFAGRQVASIDRLLTVDFSDRVHREMFGSVWRWAGRHRAADTGDDDREGAPTEQIPTLLSTVYFAALDRHDRGRKTAESRARRLHDDLLEVRAYRTGNGRHARFMANLYLHVCGEPRIDWVASDEDATPSSGLTALEAALDRVTGPTQLAESLDRATGRR